MLGEMQDPDKTRKELGSRIRRLREKRGVSQEELAHQTGFSRSFMSAIERGTKDVRLSTLLRLASIFEISLSQLFKGVDEG